MAKNDIGGVWRTVGGRRIFIKDGQDLASAMKESGKFNTKQAQMEYEHAQDKYEHHKFDDNESESKQASRKAYEDAKDKYTKASREEDEYRANKTIEENKNKYSAEYENYKKAHPNTDLTLNDYIKVKQGGVGGTPIKTSESSKTNGDDRVKSLSGKYETDNKGREVTQKEYDEFRQAYKDGKISQEDYRNDNYDALKNITENKTGKTTSQAVPKTSEKAKEFWDTYKMNDAEYESFAKQVVSENSKGYPYNKISLWANKEGKYNSETDKWEFVGMKGISNGQQSTKIEVDRDGNLYEDRKLVYDNTFKTMSGKYDYKIAPSDNAKVSTTRPKQNQSTNETNKGSNDWVRNAFNEYKKEHPNTKMTLEQFKKSKK